MQSSSSVIKGSYVNFDNEIILDTQPEALDITNNLDDRTNETFKTMKYLSEVILRKSKNESQKILNEANILAKNVEKEAYGKGYIQGEKNGYDDGYKNGYNEATKIGESEANKLIEKCTDILESCQNEYYTYLENKENEIINLALKIANKIVRFEVEKETYIERVIEPYLESLKKEENIIIKINSMYAEELKKKVEQWKCSYSFNGEIFILEDPLMKEGEAIINKKNGKIIINSDLVEDEIKKILKM